ncbi:HDIG domain protein [gamma proteobacterium IMCC2047]|nr:HDIG domain protein [gamma proteobacterium IMCC2047]
MKLFNLFNKKSLLKSASLHKQARPSPEKKAPLKISVGKLKIGMFVTELDKPWEETPFFVQGFYIRSQEDINEISIYCHYVFVDPFFDPKKVTPPQKAQKPLELQSLKEEQSTHRRVNSLTKSLLDEIRLGGRIAHEKVSAVVHECLDSIISNADALLLINKMALKFEGLEKHSIGTCILSIAFGQHLGYSTEETKKLGTSALLHDVGLLELPDELLQKMLSSQALTSQENNMLKQHVVYGRNTLMANKSLWHAVDAVYSQHEHYDGSGYPRHLEKDAIPKFAQIISLADTYDTLTTQWGGSPAISSLDALKIIYREQKKKFDPILAQKFIKFIHIYPPGSIVQIRNGDIGVIVKRNTSNKYLPTILVLRDEFGNRAKPRLVDLAKLQHKSDDQTPPIIKMYPSGSFDIDVYDLFDKGLIEW